MSNSPNTTNISRYPKQPTPGQLSSSITAAGGILTTTQIPVDVSGEVVPGGITAQSNQVLQNLANELAAFGSDLNRVLHLTIYLTDMQDRAAFNDAYSQFFKPPFPVRAAVGVQELGRPDMRVEITAIAAH